MALPGRSLTLFSDQRRTSLRPGTERRASAVLPYSRVWPDLLSTVKDSGPEPAAPWEVIRAKPSISVRYSVPSAP